MIKYLEIAAIVVVYFCVFYLSYEKISDDQKAFDTCSFSPYIKSYGVVTIKNKKYAICSGYMSDQFPELHQPILKEIK